MTTSLFTPAIENILADVSLRCSLTLYNEVADFFRYVQLQEKIETHVHVEAAVEPSYYQERGMSDLWNGIAPWKRAPFSDFRSFILAWVDLTKCIRTLRDLEEMAQAFVKSRVRENIKYSEAYFSPADFSLLRKRFNVRPEVFDFYDVMCAYVNGLRRGLEENPGFEVRLIIDSFWPSTHSEKATILESLRRAMSQDFFYDTAGVPYIVAVGFGGAEQPECFTTTAEFVTSVRSLGYKIDIHSGEGSDPSLHKFHVSELKPDRVSHGFSAIDEGWCFEENLVMCPLSNLLLKTYPGLPELHPVFNLLQRGIPIAIGSDDPLLLGHTLSQEFAFLHAVNSSLAEATFRKIQQDTRSRVLCPEVCMRVFN